jgi:putative ABC transport system permease protein
MLKNYFKIALRNLRKNKVYSIITIFGLSIGLACSMLMLVFVYYEFSYDRFNEKAGQIYRLGREISSAEGEIREPLSSAPTAAVLKQNYPEVIDAVRFKSMEKVIARYGDNHFYEEHVYYSDPSVFSIFTFPLVAGDPKTVLSSPYSAVVTEEMAQKYFGNEDPLGKVLILDKNDFIVTGVMKNLPETTHRKINILCSFETLVSMKEPDLGDWLSFNYSTYLLLRRDADYGGLESALPKLIDRFIGENTKTLHGRLSFYILPLTKLHLFSHLDGFSPGLITKIISYCSMTLLLILIACINFINLSTARSSARAKEIGIRKVVGSGKGRLVKQFLFESVIVSMFALLFSFLLVELLLPAFRNKVESKLLLSASQMNEIYIGFFLLALIIGFVSGLYPAFYLSGFQPVRVLKGNLFAGQKKGKMRSVLVVIQFALSVILICHTFNVNYQSDYLTKKDVGFNKKNLVVLPVVNDKIKESLETFKTTLLNNPDIAGVTASSALPGFAILRNVKMPEGFSKNEMQLMDEINVDADFIKALNIKIILGRNFIAGSKFDQQNSIIINELAAKKFGWSNPLGKTIRYTTGNNYLATGTVVGVVKNFHVSSMFRLIEPLFISNNSKNLNHILIRINPQRIQASLQFIKDKWKSLYPHYPFQYDFLESSYDIYFRIFDKIKEMLTIFAFLAILLACLGIFALSLFITEKRTKEIGIRKVMGDTSLGIMFRLNYELLKYVFIATLLVIPYSYFIRDFLSIMMPYTAAPDYLVYVKGVVLVFIVALLSISYQSVKAANTNPVESLKYE